MADDTLLLDTWAINNRITLYLLDALPAAALPGVGASKGRSVGGMFAHLHNTRLLWLKSASPDLLAGVSKIESDAATDQSVLRACLETSGAAVGELLARGLADGRV